jgi:hypothetical protein
MYPIKILTKVASGLMGIVATGPWPRRIFVVSSLAFEHVVNLVTLVLDQNTG